MPSWKLHNQWAQKLGFDLKNSNTVNKWLDRSNWQDLSEVRNPSLRTQLMNIPNLNTYDAYSEMVEKGIFYHECATLHILMDTIEHEIQANFPKGDLASAIDCAAIDMIVDSECAELDSSWIVHMVFQMFNDSFEEIFDSIVAELENTGAIRIINGVDLILNRKHVVIR